MIEIIIFILISLIIISSVEFFTYIRKKNSVNTYNKKNKNLKKGNVINFKTEESSSNILDKYSSDTDIEINHLPGKFYIDNDNIFIKIKDRVIIPEINVIYDIPESFTIEIINMTGENINYYYKKNIL